MESKACTKCTVVKPFSDFSPDKNRKLRIRDECRICYNAYRRQLQDKWTPERRRYKHNQQVKRHKERYHNDPKFRIQVGKWAREHVLKKKYGLTKVEVTLLLTKQNNSCCICLRDISTTYHIDHIHNTKIVRGLLCGPCNRAIGLLQENCEVLQSAINYIKKGALI